MKWKIRSEGAVCKQEAIVWNLAASIETRVMRGLRVIDWPTRLVPRDTSVATVYLLSKSPAAATHQLTRPPLPNSPTTSGLACTRQAQQITI